MEAENRIGCEAQSSAPLGHPQKSRGKIVTSIDCAFRALIPGKLTYAACVQLLDARAKYGTIHMWRFGRRRWPQWAAQRLAEHLRANAAAKLSLATRLEAEARTGPVGRRNTQALHAYRLQKAAERDAKEKAGNEPALPPQSLSEPR